MKDWEPPTYVTLSVQKRHVSVGVGGIMVSIAAFQKGNISFPCTCHCKRQARGEGRFLAEQLSAEQDTIATLRELTSWWGGRQEAPKRNVLETVLWGWAGLDSGLLRRRGI